MSSVVSTVSLSFRTLQNLRASERLPIVRIIPPRTTVLLTRLSRIDPSATIGAEPVIQIDLGADDTEPDPHARYTMPFGGTEPRQLAGGFGAPTHLAENFYALDFAMPEGTPVLAARSGIVVEVQDGFRESGLRPDMIERANLVAIAHADGTLASYGHLSPGIFVETGDTVVAGQLLGLSGSTGFSGQPHLHFHVGKRLMGGSDRTIPVDFVDPQGQPLAIVEGAWYQPSRQGLSR